jgi:hypothetical protein
MKSPETIENQNGSPRCAPATGSVRPSVKERLGHSVDEKGNIHYDERPMTWEAADKLAGKKLDRRKNYCVIDGRVCELAEWVESCSGCHETNEGYELPGTKFDANGIALGSGCHECGYQGKVKTAMWMPIDGDEW